MLYCSPPRTVLGLCALNTVPIQGYGGTVDKGGTVQTLVTKPTEGQTGSCSHSAGSRLGYYTDRGRARPSFVADRQHAPTHANRQIRTRPHARRTRPSVGVLVLTALKRATTRNKAARPPPATRAGLFLFLFLFLFYFDFDFDFLFLFAFSFLFAFPFPCPFPLSYSFSAVRLFLCTRMGVEHQARCIQHIIMHMLYIASPRVLYIWNCTAPLQGSNQPPAGR